MVYEYSYRLVLCCNVLDFRLSESRSLVNMTKFFIKFDISSLTGLSGIWFSSQKNNQVLVGSMHKIPLITDRFRENDIFKKHSSQRLTFTHVQLPAVLASLRVPAAFIWVWSVILLVIGWFISKLIWGHSGREDYTISSTVAKFYWNVLFPFVSLFNIYARHPQG